MVAASERGGARSSRRSFLAAAVALALPVPAIAAAARIAVLDWAIVEAVTALGVAPAAIAEPQAYARQRAGPDLPASVIDLGLRDQVNLELLAQVAPDLILLPSWQTADIPRLSRIAPTVGIDVYGPESPPFALAEQALRTVAAQLGRADRAEAVIRETEEALAAARAALAARQRDRAYVVSFLDERHIWVFGAASLFHEVIVRTGLRNAWQGRPSDSIVTLGIEALADAPDAWIVVTEPLQTGLLDRIRRNRLWTELPANRSGRSVMIPPLLAFGGLLTARRFADEIALHLGAGDRRDG